MPITNKENIVTVRIWRDDPIEGRLGHVSVETYRGIGNKEGNNSGSYGSFWPEYSKKELKESTDDGWLMGIGVYGHYKGLPGRHHKSVKEDRLAESPGLPTYLGKGNRGAPDVEIHLRGLNIDAINEAYQRFLDPTPFSHRRDSLNPFCYWLSFCSLLRGHKRRSAQDSDFHYKWSVFGSSILGTSFFGVPKISNCSHLASLLLYAGGIRWKRNTQASKFRLISGSLATCIIACVLIYNGVPYKDILGLSLLLIMVAGAIGSVYDAKEDVKISNTALDCVKNSYSNNQSYRKMAISFVQKSLYMMIPISAVFGGLFFTNFTQYLLTTPGHIEKLATGAAREEDIVPKLSVS